MNGRRVIINGVLAAAVAGCAVGAYLVVSNKKTTVASTTTVVTAGTGNVLSSVTGTGNVLVPTQTDVSFDSAVSSNKVLEIDVKVGDKVKAGQLLGKVDSTAATTALQLAQAQLLSAQATYDKAQNPLTADVVAQNAATLAQAKASLENAKIAVTNAQNSLDNDTVLQDTAVQQATDAVTNAQAKAAQDLANQQATVDQAQATLDTDTAKQVTAQAAYDAARGTPGEAAARAALDNATAAVAKDTTTLAGAKSQLASLQLSTAQSVTNSQNALTNADNNRTAKLNADQSAIDSSKRQLTSQQASYNATIAQLAVKEKAPTDADLAGQKVSLLNAQNSLTTAQKNLDNTTLKAPIDGTVVTLNGKLNSAASSSGSSSSGSGGTGSTGSSTSTAAFLTLTDLSALQVKVGFSESDATNVKAGLGATVTFDSLSGVAATGKVSSVDLTSTTVSNVVTYYSYVALDPSASLAQVKPGMTASVQVVVNHADGVVTLAASAVSARGTTATVNLMTGTDPKITTPTPITLGLRGDATVEVKTGLKAGDKIAIVRQSTTGVGTTGTGTRTGTATATGGLGATGGAGPAVGGPPPGG